jgi:hypothetical protein
VLLGGRLRLERAQDRRDGSRARLGERRGEARAGVGIGAEDGARAGRLVAPPHGVVAGEPQRVAPEDAGAVAQALHAAAEVVAEEADREPAQRRRRRERIGEVAHAAADHARRERAAERRAAEPVGVAAAVEQEPSRTGWKARGDLDGGQAGRGDGDHSSTFMRLAFSSAARTKNRMYSPADHTDSTSEM